jgi:CRP-like cAMP-binding protein
VTLWIGASTDRIRLLTFGPGGFFGEMALLDGHPRSADAEADTDCTLQQLSRDDFLALARVDPALHASVLNVLALQLVRRLRDTTVLLDHALR